MSLAATSLLGCGAVLGITELSVDEPSDAGADGPSARASGADASAHSDAGDAGMEGDTSAPSDGGTEAAKPTGPEVLANAGFETASGGGCGGEWQPDDSTLDLSSTARTGSHSCRICVSTRPTVSADQYFSVDGPGDVRLEAWFKDESSATGYALYYNVMDPQGTTSLLHTDTTSPSPEWQLVSYTVSLRPGERLTGLLVAITGPTGACAMADDASVKKM